MSSSVDWSPRAHCDFTVERWERWFRSEQKWLTIKLAEKLLDHLPLPYAALHTPCSCQLLPMRLLRRAIDLLLGGLVRPGLRFCLCLRLALFSLPCRPRRPQLCSLCVPFPGSTHSQDVELDLVCRVHRWVPCKQGATQCEICTESHAPRHRSWPTMYRNALQFCTASSNAAAASGATLPVRVRNDGCFQRQATQVVKINPTNSVHPQKANVRTCKQWAVRLHGLECPPPPLPSVPTHSPAIQPRKALSSVCHCRASGTPFLRLPPHPHAEPRHIRSVVGPWVGFPLGPVGKGEAAAAAGFPLQVVQRQQGREIVLVAVACPPAGALTMCTGKPMGLLLLLCEMVV